MCAGDKRGPSYKSHLQINHDDSISAEQLAKIEPKILCSNCKNVSRVQKVCEKIQFLKRLLLRVNIDRIMFT